MHTATNSFTKTVMYMWKFLFSKNPFSTSNITNSCIILNKLPKSTYESEIFFSKWILELVMYFQIYFFHEHWKSITTCIFQISLTIRLSITWFTTLKVFEKNIPQNNQRKQDILKNATEIHNMTTGSSICRTQQSYLPSFRFDWIEILACYWSGFVDPEGHPQQ